MIMKTYKREKVFVRSLFVNLNFDFMLQMFHCILQFAPQDDDDFLGWSSGTSKSQSRESIDRASAANAAAAAARDGSSRQDKWVGNNNTFKSSLDDEGNEDSFGKDFFENRFGNGDPRSNRYNNPGSFWPSTEEDASVLVVTPSFRFEVT